MVPTRRFQRLRRVSFESLLVVGRERETDGPRTKLEAHTERCCLTQAIGTQEDQSYQTPSDQCQTRMRKGLLTFLFHCERLRSLLVLLSDNGCGSCLYGDGSRNRRRDVVLHGQCNGCMVSVGYTLDCVSAVFCRSKEEKLVLFAFCDYTQDKT